MVIITLLAANDEINKILQLADWVLLLLGPAAITGISVGDFNESLANVFAEGKTVSLGRGCCMFQQCFSPKSRSSIGFNLSTLGI